MGEQARTAWQRLKAIDDRDVPLGTRLFCAITAGLQYGGQRTLERLREWQDLSERSGFDSLASICRVYITDELLIAGKYAEAVDAAERFIAAGESRPRFAAMIRINLVLALIQLGRVDEAHAPARMAMRTLPSLAYVVIATYALAMARQARFMDAVLLAGYSDGVRRLRDEWPDPAEADAHAETLSRLRTAFGEARLQELLQIGASMSIGDISRIALPTESPVPRVA